MAFCSTLRSVKELSCKASFPNGAFEVFKGSELFLDYKYWKCEYLYIQRKATLFIIVTTVSILRFYVYIPIVNPLGNFDLVCWVGASTWVTLVFWEQVLLLLGYPYHLSDAVSIDKVINFDWTCQHQLKV